ncbi:MAG: hypothetical protein KAS04_00415, partial [Candidatus Aenigmarchaeota archaeon]|nr:hypothetical protein [Candidatus Aenigmarchaeota archaeon]
MMGIIEMLPQILSVVQLSMYIVLAWVFGSLAVKGLKKDIPFAIKMAVMMGAGFLCVMSGVALRGFLFFMKGTIFETLQMDSFIMGLLASIILALSFLMITREDEKTNNKGTIKTLRERIGLLEGILIKTNAPMLKETEVKKTAETLLRGYDAKEAKLNKNNWEILLVKDEKRAIVVMGAFTGEIKSVEKQGSHLLKDPIKIVGVAAIIILAIVVLLNFRGFPSMLDSIASMIGMDPQELGALFGDSSNLPEGCVPTVRILMQQGVNVMGGEGTYSNENVRQMIESQTGRQVFMMYEAEYANTNYILSITLPSDMTLSGFTNEELMENMQICSSTEETFCECIDVPDINMPTGFIVAR